MNISTDQKFIYRVDILQVFTRDTRTYRQINDGVPAQERQRLETPTLLGIKWFSTARAARNYGSGATGRSEWYNNLHAPKYHYERVYNEPRKSQWDYELVRVDHDAPYEPSKDYKVYKVAVDLTLSNAIEIPQLKKLSD